MRLCLTQTLNGLLPESSIILAFGKDDTLGHFVKNNANRLKFESKLNLTSLSFNLLQR